IRQAEDGLARTEQHRQSLAANIAVDQARQADRESRLANVKHQLAQLTTDASELEARLAHTRQRLTSATTAQQAAAARLDQSREALRLASQQADRLHGALEALGATDLTRVNDADLPPDWQTALEDLPVVGLAGELATRIRPINSLLSAYLRRIVVLADDQAAREAHHRLSERLAADTPAWAVLSMDGLLMTASGARPLEPAGDGGESALADWSRQVRQLEAELQAAESRRRSALAEVQAARDALDDAEADERGARLALGEAETRLAEL